MVLRRHVLKTRELIFIYTAKRLGLVYQSTPTAASGAVLKLNDTIIRQGGWKAWHCHNAIYPLLSVSYSLEANYFTTGLCILD